jgi:hypothetical protein
LQRTVRGEGEGKGEGKREGKENAVPEFKDF